MGKLYPIIHTSALLIVTWGAQGAYYLLNDASKPAQTFAVPPSHVINSVDPIGAGDTFIAGILLTLGQQPNYPWTNDIIRKSVLFAVNLATLKCSQRGFVGLAARSPLLAF
jgi:ketohexokinase